MKSMLSKSLSIALLAAAGSVNAKSSCNDDCSDSCSTKSSKCWKDYCKDDCSWKDNCKSTKSCKTDCWDDCKSTKSCKDDCSWKDSCKTTKSCKTDCWDDCSWKDNCKSTKSCKTDCWDDCKTSCSTKSCNTSCKTDCWDDCSTTCRNCTTNGGISNEVTSRRRDCNNDCNSCDTNCGDGCFVDCNTDCNSCDNDCYKCCGDVNYQTHFSIRPQEMNAARWLIGTAGNTHLCGKEEFYGYAGVALEYTQSFKNSRLASYFGDCNGCLVFGQGTIEDNDPNTIKAINWGLTGEGESCLCAKVQTFIADLQFWVGLDEWVCGWWADLRVPIAWTKWQLNASCGNYSSDTTVYADPEEENSVSTIADTPVVYTDIPSALNGASAFGMVPALKYGRFGNNCNSDTASGVPGLRFDIGYDFYRSDCGYLGLGFTVVAPTGNRPEAYYLFEPILGAQKNWQLGGYLVGGWELWNCNDEQALTAYLDATVVTLVKSKQRRLFGVKEKGGLSSFMLLKQFTNDCEFIGLDRLANLATVCGKFRSKVMTDIAVMFQYTNCGFIASLGYDFWYRSREEFCGGCYDLPYDPYGIKGSLAVAGEQQDMTASRSTIFVPAEPDSTNGSSSPLGVSSSECEDMVFITPEDLTACPSLNPRAWSNKVFGALGYQWCDCDWQPSLFLFGEAEFGKDNVAISQWGVGLKGGIAF